MKNAGPKSGAFHFQGGFSCVALLLLRPSERLRVKRRHRTSNVVLRSVICRTSTMLCVFPTCFTIAIGETLSLVQTSSVPSSFFQCAQLNVPGGYGDRFRPDLAPLRHLFLHLSAIFVVRVHRHLHRTLSRHLKNDLRELKSFVTSILEYIFWCRRESPSISIQYPSPVGVISLPTMVISISCGGRLPSVEPF